MTRIFAILFGLFALAACDTGGSYLATSNSGYESGTYGSGGDGSGSY